MASVFFHREYFSVRGHNAKLMREFRKLRIVLKVTIEFIDIAFTDFNTYFHTWSLVRLPM